MALNIKKKVLIISNFHEDNGISRTNIAFNYFLKKGYNVNVLYSNFSHSLKKFRYLKNKNFIPLNTISYSSSLSLRRILSYFIFSFRVFIFLNNNKYNIIYFNIPPNIISIPVLLKKKKSKIIVDIIDMWPESFPHGGHFLKKLPILLMGWLLQKIRKFAVDKSDYCIAESNLFYNKLNLKTKVNSKVIQLKKIENSNRIFSKPSKNFSIAYLGNIGSIYDFESLMNIIKNLENFRSVHLHIIGLGPKSDWLFKNLEIRKIKYTYHGASFEENFKSKIISKCWFGYNGYKKNTEVALSYKSVDYLSFGLPLINSAKHDTMRLINSQDAGFNFDDNQIGVLVNKLSKISYEDIIKMKKAAYKVFQKNFSYDSYSDEMDEVLSKLI